MEEQVRQSTHFIALGLEAFAALLIAVGGIEALYKIAKFFFQKSLVSELQRSIWLGFARWILLGLEFMMAADIVGTIVSPTWDAIGMLASIALIRTFLSFFLERDLEVEKFIEKKGAQRDSRNRTEEIGKERLRDDIDRAVGKESRSVGTPNRPFRAPDRSL
jgi:uncharacterized membrane protein